MTLTAKKSRASRLDSSPIRTLTMVARKERRRLANESEPLMMMMTTKKKKTPRSTTARFHERSDQKRKRRKLKMMTCPTARTTKLRGCTWIYQVGRKKGRALTTVSRLLGPFSQSTAHGSFPTVSRKTSFRMLRS
jgi:hypothetical protein